MRRLIPLILLLLAPTTASSQRVVGRVIDATSEAGIPHVDLRIESAGGIVSHAVSDSMGRFLIRATAGPGRYRLSADHFAYAASHADIELGELDQLEVLIRLSGSPVELPPIEVLARSRAPDAFLERAGYYDRKSGRFGVFLDPAEVERRKPLNTSDLFRQVPGVRVIMLGGVRGNDIRITRGEDPNCTPRIYIDRVIVRRGGRQADATEPTLDALIPPVNLHAIEIYRSPTEIPLEFGGNYVTCGVVLIWTKRAAARF